MPKTSAVRKTEAAAPRPAPRNPVGIAVRHCLRLLTKLTQEMRRTVTTPDVEAVHDLRVSIRRLMAALDLFKSGLRGHGAKKIRKQIKQLLELAGPVRDCDVAARYIEKHVTEPAAPPELLAAIEAKRQQAVPALLEGVRERIAKRSVLKWRRKLRSAPADASVEQDAREILEKMIEEFVTRGRRAANPHASGSQLHHFRIAAKSLHYALELPVGPEPATWMEDAKAVQKIVGDIHDCEAVRSLIAGMPGHEHAAKSLRNRQRKKRSQFRELWQERLAARSPAEVVISRRPPAAATQP